jgi:hypothetical protein
MLVAGMRARLRALALASPLLALAGAGCRGQPPQEDATSLGLPRAPELRLPKDWRTLAPEAFESWVLAAFPEGVVTPLEENSLRELRRALDEVLPALPNGSVDPVTVRAAVILGRSRHPSSAAVIIRRLEKRVLGPERWSDCGDSVAAAALARFPNPRRYATRLVPLAVGSRPHPDLEVRVECAATALYAGFPAVIPFLLQVLRIDTFAGQKDLRDFAVAPTTDWARQRAAEALSAYAGVPVEYRVDGPIAQREEAAAKLEALLTTPPAPSAAPATK